MKAVSALLLPLAMACTTVPADGGASRDEPAEAVGSGQPCRSGELGELVGREAAEALGAEALRRSGARSLRWIRPGDVVTMDYREDRLNIHLDARGRVERLACG